MALNKNSNRQIQKGNRKALVHFGKSEPMNKVIPLYDAEI